VHKFGEQLLPQLCNLQFQFFWVGLFDQFWLSLLGTLALVGYWFAIEILLSVKVKVLGGGINVYGWVTILLYFLWLKEHTHFTNTPNTWALSHKCLNSVHRRMI
jgi:hypothetical protein